MVSLPLEGTGQKLDTAIRLIDQGKLHEANLELKQIQDSLVVTTATVAEPLAKTATAQTHENQPAKTH